MVLSGYGPRHIGHGCNRNLDATHNGNCNIQYGFLRLCNLGLFDDNSFAC